jgi:hypothetical protein
MPHKDSSLDKVCRDAWRLLRKDPVMFAPMLIFSVGLALVENSLGLKFNTWDQSFFIFVGLATSVSLAFQLWALAMMWQASKGEAITLTDNLKLAGRVYPIMLAILSLMGFIAAGIVYGVYLVVSDFPNGHWIVVGAGAICVIAFVLYSEFLPVAVTVDRGPVFKQVALVSHLIQAHSPVMFRYVLLLLALVGMASIMAVGLSALAFVPPLVQGALATYILALTCQLYLSLTQVNVLS